MRILCMAAVFVFASLAAAQIVPSTAPTSASGPATTSSAPAIDPAAYKLLAALEQAGTKYATLQAAIEYAVTDPNVGSTEVRNGTVAYQRQTEAASARFRIQFDNVKIDNAPVTAEKKEYAFDGQWLTITQGKIKNMTRKQVAAPGEKVEPLKLGKGPFPLPFGQKADEVTKMFAAKTRDPRPADPRNTAYLELTPHPGQEKEYDFSRLQMWIDRDTSLPAKIISTERNQQVKTVIFKDVRAGQTLDPKIFYPDKPAGWDEIKEPLERK